MVLCLTERERERLRAHYIGLRVFITFIFCVEQMHQMSACMCVREKTICTFNMPVIQWVTTKNIQFILVCAFIAFYLYCLCLCFCRHRMHWNCSRRNQLLIIKCFISTTNSRFTIEHIVLSVRIKIRSHTHTQLQSLTSMHSHSHMHTRILVQNSFIWAPTERYDEYINSSF